MTMRFTEREKFRDGWYMNLTPVEKCIWEYMVSECDHAGLLEFNLRMMSVQIGAEITVQDLKRFEVDGKIKFVDAKTIYIPNFVLFQQRIDKLEQLNPKNRCHKSIIELLTKHHISPFDALIKGHESPLSNTENIDIIEDLSPIKGACKPLERGYSNSNSNSNSNIDIYCNQNFEKCFSIYETCDKLIPLRFERRSRAILELLRDYLEETDYNFNYFQELCEKANKLGKIVDTMIDFKMLLKNHAGIMSGKYDKGKTVKDYTY